MTMPDMFRRRSWSSGRRRIPSRGIDAFYVPKELFEQWAKNDPLERFRTWLRENAELTGEEEEEISGRVKKLLNDALSQAEDSPQPDPETVTQGVWATPEDLDTPHHK